MNINPVGHRAAGHVRILSSKFESSETGALTQRINNSGMNFDTLLDPSVKPRLSMKNAGFSSRQMLKLFI